MLNAWFGYFFLAYIFIVQDINFGNSKSVWAMVFFKLSSPDGDSNFFPFAITDEMHILAYSNAENGTFNFQQLEAR